MVLLLTTEDTEVFTIWFGDANCWAYRNDTSNETCTIVDSIRHYDLFKLPFNINIQEPSWDPNYSLYNAIYLLGLPPDDPLVREKLQEAGSSLGIVNNQVEVNIEARVYTTSEVVSIILKALAEKIRSKHHAFKNIIVVHEFHYRAEQKKCFQKICSDLGIKVQGMINCETAIASDSYLKMTGVRGWTNFLVFNIGYNGRRSSISLIQFDKMVRETHVKVMAKEEFFYFFDTKRNALILNLVDIICAQHNIPIAHSTRINAAEWNLAFVSHQVALKLYIENLSNLTMNCPSNFLFPFHPQLQERIGASSGQVAMSIVKNHFDRIYPVDMNRFHRITEDLLRKSELDMTKIHGIVLVDISKHNTVAGGLVQPIVTAQPNCEIYEMRYFDHDIIYTALKLRNSVKAGRMNVIPSDEAEAPAIGIDVGTSFCTAAFFTRNNVNFQDSSQCSTLSSSSSISFDRDGNQLAVGEETRNLPLSSNSYTISDLKRLLGRSFDDPDIERLRSSWPFEILEINKSIKIQIGTSMFSPEELIAKIITHVKNCIEDTLGKPVTRAVLAIPKFFNFNQRALMEGACKSAGLTVLRVIDESTAAALTYTLTVIQESFVGSDHFLIFDLGGSTLNVAVIELLQSRLIRIKAIRENCNLGGEDFDREIFDYCIEEFKSQHDVDLTLRIAEEDDVAVAKRLSKLRLACEEGKTRLSIRDQEEVKIVVERIHGLLDMNIVVKRNMFESRIERYLNECLHLVDDVIKSTGITAKDIRKVVLVGGSSKIPRVQQIFQTKFGEEKILIGTQYSRQFQGGESTKEKQLKNFAFVNLMRNNFRIARQCLPKLGALFEHLLVEVK
ncbi:unnamed protein product [Allacma fusca]|uniref:Uncharacterized protein n=1 Tax=Allacma fusca TaxID=39272 RepID=A0A8J2M0E2_9HEXA|nr:unnamed protein product [Allacma fusca]